ncbi:MAG: alanine:cation symporter family protein [Clostridium sp.]|jgi:AGCS family alanine or glycine:cation symporter|nr:alanine:cation symporter family protein [Clostridium sp.]
MDQFIKAVKDVNSALNSFVWGPIMLVFFLAVGLLFTIGSGVFQVTRVKSWMQATFLSIFKHKHVRKTKEKHAISQFQSLCTALAATVGTGNIVGVATAIALGGPGAVFWMWLSAFLGMMTNFAENTLGIKYRYKNEKGEWVGGAMIYIERGLGSVFKESRFKFFRNAKFLHNWKWLAIVFSVFCALASFGIGNMSQANSIAAGLESNFSIPLWVTGLLVLVFVALVILGGIKRIASVAEKIVPFMVLLYLAGGLVVVFAHIGNVGSAFSLIFTEAFNFQAGASGVLGYGIAQAAKRGISRGVFSNEAGLGSSVMVHSASDVKEPVTQGMWGIFEVFADTIIVCTITALSILASGVYNMNTALEHIAAGKDPVQGAELTSSAFATIFGPIGGQFVAIAIMLFAFTTILGWSFYGERAITYLFGRKAVVPYKVIFVGFIMIGCTIPLKLVWDISDTLNGFMSIPNLFAITLMSGQVFAMIRGFKDKQKIKA